MTPTDQTRLDEIRRDLDLSCVSSEDASFLLSLLSQETKRADEAEARTWEEAAAIAEKQALRGLLVYPGDFRAKAAAVRRGREGE